MPTVPLHRIAQARSGDKGEGSNVGILARSEAAYTFLAETLTEARVQDFLKEINFGGVTRYLAPNMRVLNFLLEGQFGRWRIRFPQDRRPGQNPRHWAFAP